MSEPDPNLLADSSELDRNKSPLTLKITSGVEVYLKDKGFKPIETEVPIEDGWVADVASVIVPTPTELIAMKLVPRKPRMADDWSFWRVKFGDKYWETPEYKQKQAQVAEHTAQWNALIQAYVPPFTAVVEVKTTKGDFQRDDKWIRPSPVSLRYLAIPAGMLKRHEYPQDWFILEFSAEGKLLRVAQEGKFLEIPPEKKMWIIHNIALRRHHRTEHVWLRGVRKKFLAEQSEKKQHNRVSNIVMAMKDILYGIYATPEETMRYHGVKWESLPFYAKKEIEALFGKLKL